MASYIETNLLRGERITHEARLHAIIFLIPLAVLFASMVALIAGAVDADPMHRGPLILAFLFGSGYAVVKLVLAGVRWATTEMAVTDRRVLIKTGFISRRTLELRLDRIETVSIDQGVLGRLLGYGSITVIGTGGTQEPFADVADPIAFRTAVTHYAERAAPHGHPAAAAG